MNDREIPVQITVGNVTAKTVADIARSGDVRTHLAEFLRAFADQLDDREENPDGGKRQD